MPTVLGFDPRLQFVHDDDGLEVLRLCTVEDRPGTFNVAGDGVLTAVAGDPARRPAAAAGPAPAGLVGRRRSSAGPVSSTSRPSSCGSSRYGRVVDTTPAARPSSASRPAYTTAEAFDDFVHAHGLDRHCPAGAVAEAEQRSSLR